MDLLELEATARAGALHPIEVTALVLDAQGLSLEDIARELDIGRGRGDTEAVELALTRGRANLEGWKARHRQAAEPTDPKGLFTPPPPPTPETTGDG